MKLIEAIKFKGGLPFKIPDCSRDDLSEFFVQMGYKVGAEIGVFRGEFTEVFCKAGLKIYAIDPWMAYRGAGRTEKVQDKQDLNFEYAKKNLAPYPNCEIIRKTSMDAVGNFKDESLDFVYIDGDHRFRYIAEDIFEWGKKVKKGGIVSGHDYFFTNPKSTNVICQVGPVVDAYIKVMEIENLYIFGGTKNTKDKNNRYPSWMFLKP